MFTVLGGSRLLRRAAVRVAWMTAVMLTSFWVTPSLAAFDRWEFLVADLSGIPIRTIAVDPLDSSTIYVGVSNGAIAFDPGANVPEEGSGILKSVDGGTTWNPSNSGLSDLNVTAIVIDPASTSTLWAATDGGGVFKSTDGGQIWAASSDGLPSEGEVYALMIDPLTPATLYAGTEHDGVFKSTNAGATWSAANSGLAVNAQTLEIWSLAVDPVTPTTVYAGTRAGLFKTTNGATSWTATPPLSWVDPNYGTQPSKWIYAVAVDPTQPQTVYVGVLDAGGVFRSDDGGATWVLANDGLDYYAGWSYITALVIDPNDHETLYAGTQDRGVFKTDDGGATWVPLNAGISHQGVYAIAFDSENPASLYAGGVLGSVYRLGSDPLALDDYRCFKIKAPRVPTAPVTLVDDLETRTTAVGKPRTFCEPVSISGSPIEAADTYLTCYAISRNDYAGPEIIGYDHQFSSSSARDLEPATLCLPTQIQGGPPAANLNRFKGYAAERAPASLYALTLTGDFGSQKSKFYRHSSVMVPVDVDGGGVPDPSAHLACYELKYKEHGFAIPRPEFMRQDVTIENALGTQTIELVRPQTLCLPALRTFLAP